MSNSNFQVIRKLSIASLATLILMLACFAVGFIIYLSVENIPITDSDTRKGLMIVFLAPILGLIVNGISPLVASDLGMRNYENVNKFGLIKGWAVAGAIFAFLNLHIPFMMSYLLGDTESAAILFKVCLVFNIGLFVLMIVLAVKVGGFIKEYRSHLYGQPQQMPMQASGVPMQQPMQDPSQVNQVPVQHPMQDPSQVNQVPVQQPVQDPSQVNQVPARQPIQDPSQMNQVPARQPIQDPSQVEQPKPPVQ